jgi:hypothetical protein
MNISIIHTNKYRVIEVTKENDTVHSLHSDSVLFRNHKSRETIIRVFEYFVSEFYDHTLIE